MLKIRVAIAIVVLSLASSAHALDLTGLSKALVKVAKGADPQELAVFAKQGDHIALLGGTETIRTNLSRFVQAGKNSKGTYLLVEASPKTASSGGRIEFVLARVEQKFRRMDDDDLYWLTPSPNVTLPTLNDMRMPYYVADQFEPELLKVVTSVEQDLGINITKSFEAFQPQALDTTNSERALILQSFSVDANAVDAKVVKELMNRFSQM